MLYHGSPYKHENLVPKESSLLDDESVVYATDVYDMAVLFSAQLSNLHIDCGTVNGKFYVLEKFGGVFEKLKRPGYIHFVSNESFKTDNRLGMSNHEFISNKIINVQKVTYVANIYRYLKEESKIINLVTWEQMIEQIEPLLYK